MIERLALDIIVQNLRDLTDEFSVQLAVCEPRTTCTLVTLAHRGFDIHLARWVLYGFHVRDHVLALKVLDGCFVNGFVQVGGLFNLFSPGPFIAPFVDNGENYGLLAGEGAVPVWKDGISFLYMYN